MSDDVLVLRLSVRRKIIPLLVFLFLFASTVSRAISIGEITTVGRIAFSHFGLASFLLLAYGSASLALFAYVIPYFNKLTIGPDGLALCIGGFPKTVAFRDIEGVFRTKPEGGTPRSRRSSIVADLKGQGPAYVAYDLNRPAIGDPERATRHPFAQDGTGTIPLVKGKTVDELASLLNARLQHWRETGSAA